MVPAEGGPKILKLESPWHRRRRSKILAVSLKHWKGRRGGEGVPVGGGTPPPRTVYGRSNTSLHPRCPPDRKRNCTRTWHAALFPLLQPRLVRARTSIGGRLQGVTPHSSVQINASAEVWTTVIAVCPSPSSPHTGGGGVLCTARALHYAMHNYAQVCTTHLDEDTRGLQTKGIPGLLTIRRLAAGGTPRSSSFHRLAKHPQQVETCAGAFWWMRPGTDCKCRS